jgi:hypothetical protein
VFSAIPSARAISPLLSPRASNASTLDSRRVSLSGG